MTALGKISPAEARKNAALDRCEAYRLRLDDHLATLPSDAARFAFLEKLLDDWERRYRKFQTDAAKDEPVTGTAWEYLTTICDVEERLRKNAPVTMQYAEAAE